MVFLLAERFDELCFADATASIGDEAEVIVFGVERVEFVVPVVEHSYNNDYYDNDSAVSTTSLSPTIDLLGINGTRPLVETIRE